MAFRYTPEQYEAWKAQILDLLTRSGPLSVSDVWLALKGKISDVMVRRTLEQLVADGRVTAKSAALLRRVANREVPVKARVYSIALPSRKSAKRRTRRAR